MDYMCRLGLLGSRPLLLGVATCRPELLLGRQDIFFSCPPALLSIFTLLIFFLCFYDLQISFVLFPYESVLKTFVHEFHITYSHTEWNFFSSLIENGDN